VSSYAISALVARFGGSLVGPAGASACGGEGVIIHRLSTLAEAGPGALAFFTHRGYRAQALGFGGAALVVEAADAALPGWQWVHGAPRQLQRELSALFAPFALRRVQGRSALAVVAPSAVLAADVALGPGVVVGPGVRIGAGTTVGANAVIEEGCVLGEGCHIGPGVYLGPRCILGARVVIGPNAVIGDQGFAYEAASPAGPGARSLHIGGVVLGDDVHIGAGTCIDAGTLAPTRVGAGSRVDNLVHLAHNVCLGERCLVLAQVGVAGSTRLEDDCILAGQVGVAQHLVLGAGSQVAAKSGVARSLPPGAKVGGIPAMEIGRWRRTVVQQKDLDERVRAFDARLQRLERGPCPHCGRRRDE